MSEHHDILEKLNENISLKEKLIATHETLKSKFPFIVRIAFALYDPLTSVLKTYIHSSSDENPLEHYQALLDDAPSLKNILHKKLPRVINNMVTFDDGHHEHTRRIGRQGYAASYTLPMYNEGKFMGFIFFNSDTQDVFTESILEQIDLYAHLIALMIANEVNSIQTLSAAVKTTGSLTHFRDPETGSHLNRMSLYSRLIANELADKYHLDDVYIEHIFMFSPLHDIGKIGIPDSILLKEGPLDADEKIIMQTHASKGRKMVDDLLHNFGFEHIKQMDILRNIAEYHHESVNGHGYPSGLKGNDIPLEARIIAVADVFDALTSARPYKEAWDNERAVNKLKELAGASLDQDCVKALVKHMDEIMEIQAKFKEHL